MTRIDSEVSSPNSHLNIILDMGETQGIMYPLAKFLSRGESMKAEKLCASKIQWQEKHNILFENGEMEMKTGIVGTKQVQNPTRQIPFKL